MKKLITLIFVVSACVSALAEAVTVTTGSDASGHTLVPVGANVSALGGASVNYATQQLYLASELGGVSKAGNISAISFHYKTGTNYMNARSSWKLYINTTSETDLEDNKFLDKGTLVYSSSSFNVPNSDSWYKLDFSSPFAWNGTSNIVITIIDESNSTMPTSKSHWAYTTTYARSIYLRKGTDEAIPNPLTGTTSTRKDTYVANAKFTINLPDVVAPSTPDDMAVSATTTNSATLSWSSVSGATSYDLQQSADGESWSTLASGLTGTSYSWTGLDAESTHYVQIRANNAVGSSDWSSSVAVTTDAVFEYKDITFDKWASSNSLPTSGNYYINSNMNFDAYATDEITLTGDLNLCLNGKTVNMEAARFIVPDGKTLTIYDNLGGGKLTSFVGAQVGEFESGSSAFIKVKSGGTLVLKEGAIENSYNVDDEYFSYAIYSNGTLIMSGEPVINSNDADIYLSASGVITLSGALTNSEKYSVMKYSGTTLTSGWSTNMGGEDPRDYLISADDEKSVYFNGSEAALRTLLNLSESSSNSSISLNYNKVVDVNLTRSLTSSQYNTFCLPFALSDAQLQEAFGEGYDLQEFVSSSLVEETLELNFNKVYALEAGKPYLLKPSVDVANPIFQGVTITETNPVDQTSDTYISFKGIYKPTELTGGNQNILFLGAENELFWPETTDNLKGFRAYFEVKGGVSKIAKRARIVNKEDAATNLDKVQGNNVQRTKYIENGQLFILYNGTKYNVQGQVIK